MLKVIFLQLLALLMQFSSAEVTFLSRVQTIYDSSPTLRIKLAGIPPTDIDKVSIVIGTQGSPSLRSKADFVASKVDDDNDSFVFKLLPQKLCVSCSFSHFIFAVI